MPFVWRGGYFQKNIDFARLFRKKANPLLPIHNIDEFLDFVMDRHMAGPGSWMSGTSMFSIRRLSIFSTPPKINEILVVDLIIP
jgi:hypothetical protein